MATPWLLAAGQVIDTSVANPLPTQEIVNGAAVSTANPYPVTIAGSGTGGVTVTGAVAPLVTSLDYTPTGTLVTGTLTATAQAAPGASLYNSNTGISLSWDSLTNAVTFTLRDGAAGTVMWQLRIPAATAGQHSASWETPKTGTVNTLVQVGTSDPGVAGSIYWALIGTVVK